MSETTEPTAGKQEQSCKACGQPASYLITLSDGRVPVCLRHYNHPDLAEMRAALQREHTGDLEALAKVLYAADSGTVVLDMSESQEVAEAILASGWLDAVRRKAGDDRAKQIAQAIEAEARVCNQGADWRWGLEHAARTVRETR